ncbi:hypothetical protein ACWEJ6_46805 [Nonomuraea sp. NPDC004702]
MKGSTTKKNQHPGDLVDTLAVFDQLYADSATGGRLMALARHPFVIGKAFRAKTLTTGRPA